MKWAYGVTTCKSRLSNLLPRTLASLAKAGFPSPTLFCDGVVPSDLPETVRNLPAVFRYPTIRTFGNWVLSAWELYLRNPMADRFAIFQDDFVTYPNLREYLEACDYPRRGYWNLYTFPQNTKSFSGWYLSNQLGKGAVALIFNNETLRTLLASNHMVDRVLDGGRGHKFVDGGVVDSLKKAGWQEYVHNPSLVQHTGLVSSMGNGTHSLADTFRGEDFDAREMIEKPRTYADPPQGKKRLGIVGPNTASGLGVLNRQLATYSSASAWLVKPHSTYPTLPPHAEVDTFVCPTGKPSKIETFVRSVDVVVFAETPHYPELISIAKKHNRRVVCIPMMEWMTPGCRGWPQHVDLFLCPTKQAYDLFAHVVPCTYFPWPVDTDTFQFKERKTCRRFLYLAGHGGYADRKGVECMKKVLELWPDMPLTIRSQKRFDWPETATVLGPVEDPATLYDEGDVLICPHSVDGLGLEPLEALAAGMPVISTDGLPWNEYLSIGKIPASVSRRSIRRPVNWYSPDPSAIVAVCRSLLGQDISQQSHEARKWAEDRSWSKKSDEFDHLVGFGTASISVKGTNNRWDLFLFKEALEGLPPGGIVEIGAIRDANPKAKHSDGWATVVWGESGRPTVSLDINRKAVALTREMTEKHPNVDVIQEDGIVWMLAEGSSPNRVPTRLVYLDGPDPDQNGQKFCVDALMVAHQILAPGGRILIDDCDLENRGKGRYAIPRAQELGMRVLADNGRQILLEKPS